MLGPIITLDVVNTSEMVSGIVASIKHLVSPEVLLAIGGFIFNILALPTLFSEDAAIPKIQSIPSSIVLFFCFALPYYTIGFHLSAIANTTGALLWGLIAIYRSPEDKTTEHTTHSNSKMAPADD